MKPQANTFSKYCEYNIEKSLTQSIHILYKVQTTKSRKKTFSTYYEAFLNVRNPSAE
jgi:hypothetical protein